MGLGYYISKKTKMTNMSVNLYYYNAQSTLTLTFLGFVYFLLLF